MNDGHSEETKSPGQGTEINHVRDPSATQGTKSGFSIQADEPVLNLGGLSAEDAQAKDIAAATFSNTRSSGALEADASTAETFGNALDAVVNDTATTEDQAEEEGKADPRIQLPAVVPGGPVTKFMPPMPFDPEEAFFLKVRQGLPPKYELDETTGQICTRSAAAGRAALCGPLRVSALIRGADGKGWSREVEFSNLDGILCTHVIPAAELVLNGRASVAKLMDLGLDVVGDAALLAHLIRNAKVEARAEIVRTPGWTMGCHPAFVLPTGEVVARETADGTPRYEYQGPRSEAAATTGTLKKWQDELAVYAIGNAAMIFVICYAFLGPIMSLLGINTAGFHIYHKTSAGKSAAARVAQSVWPSITLQGWNVTIPAIEQICLESHETFLVLDELRKDAKLDLGEAIYLIFNGSNRAISAGKNKRAAKYWNVALLSTGEEAAQDILAENKAVRAGLLVRLIDVRLVRENEELYPELHGFRDSYSLVKHLEAQVKMQSGTAGRAFVQALVNDHPMSKAKIKEFHARMCVGLRRHLGLEDELLQGEVARVVERFAAIASAGELAIHMGILPWSKKDAYSAVYKFAKRWLEDRGGNVSSEVGTVVAQARDYLTRFGDTRFQSVEDARARRVVKDLAGWTFGEHFHLTPAAFKMACVGGMGIERAARCLYEAGYLTPGGELGSLQNRMPSGVRDHSLMEDAKDRPRCYSIKKSILAA